MDKLNLGLIGCGYWGKNHLRTLKNMGGVGLSYVCDCGTPSVKIPRDIKFTENYKDILRDSKIEAVIIATPTSTHYSLAKDFLNAGKHVFVEKPLTTKVGEAEDLCRIANEKNAQLMVGEIFRFNPAIKFIKKEILGGEIGDLRYIESRRVGLGPIRHDVSALWDLATHDIYISNLFVGGCPSSVSYNGFSHNKKLDDISCLNIKYNSQEVLTTIYVNWEHPIKERKLIVGGTKKAISFDDVEPSEKIRIYDRGVDYQPISGDFGDFQATTRDGKITIPKINITQPLEEELKHFIDCIRGKAKCLCNGYEGLQTVRVLETAEESRNKKGLEITIK